MIPALFQFNQRHIHAMHSCLDVITAIGRIMHEMGWGRKPDGIDPPFSQRLIEYPVQGVCFSKGTPSDHFTLDIGMHVKDKTLFMKGPCPPLLTPAQFHLP